MCLDSSSWKLGPHGKTPSLDPRAGSLVTEEVDIREELSQSQSWEKSNLSLKHANTAKVPDPAAVHQTLETLINTSVRSLLSFARFYIFIQESERFLSGNGKQKRVGLVSSQ